MVTLAVQRGMRSSTVAPDYIRKEEGEKNHSWKHIFIRSVFALYGFTLRFSAPTLNPDLVGSVSWR